jgi:hypothetical protein
MGFSPSFASGSYHLCDFGGRTDWRPLGRQRFLRKRRRLACARGAWGAEGLIWPQFQGFFVVLGTGLSPDGIGGRFGFGTGSL